jgi:putative ABC transport system permease protein
MVRERFYTVINLVGLSTAFATVLFIAIYVHHELSYDNMHPSVERTYRVNQTNIWSENGGFMSSTVLPLARALRDEFPEIESTLRINTVNMSEIRYVDKNGEEQVLINKGILGADSLFFNFFAFNLIHGNKEKALTERNSIVISREAAISMFGRENVVGRELYLGEKRIPVRVTAVTAEQPDNVHFNFDYLVSIYTNPEVEQFEWSWIWTQVATYVRLKPGINPSDLESKMDHLVAKYGEAAFARLGMDLQTFESKKGKYTFKFQPVTAIRLYSSETYNRIGPIGNVVSVYILSSIGLLVLVLAFINFVNLSTARSMVRANEIGVRKTLGSSGRQIRLQFYFETYLTIFIATCFGYMIFHFLKPLVFSLFAFNFEISLFNNPYFFVTTSVLIVVLGLIAGGYPSLVLSRFQPQEVLKGKGLSNKDPLGFRKGLVSVQFVISTIMIAATVIVYKQIDFFSSKDVGFNKENVLFIEGLERLGESEQYFKNWILELPEVENAAIGMDVPKGFGYQDFYALEGSEKEVSVNMLKVDQDYIETLKFELISGRNLRDGNPADKRTAIINEAALLAFGIEANEAIGKRIDYHESSLEIIGVVRNFHFMPLQYEVEPLMLLHKDAPLWGNQRLLAVKYNSTEVNQLLSKMEEQWKTISNRPFVYGFLDEALVQNYSAEYQLGRLIASLSILAVLIASIGLFGLSAFTLEQRRKEISVRKVLGASMTSIVMLLNRTFTRPLIAACIIGLPLAWIGMQEWLSQFAYRTPIGWFEIAVVISILMGFTLLTVSVQSVKAAYTNPVKWLKDE